MVPVCLTNMQNLKMHNSLLGSMVGIYWHIPIIKNKLVSITENLDIGESYGDFIVSSYDHYTYWEVLREKHAQLANVEYEFYPRGRVSYHKPSKTFYVYIDKNINTYEIKTDIIDMLNLKNMKTKFMFDAHYRTKKHVLSNW